jgi:tyrosyl-tRNA synthetase
VLPFSRKISSSGNWARVLSYSLLGRQARDVVAQGEHGGEVLVLDALLVQAGGLDQRAGRVVGRVRRCHAAGPVRVRRPA